MSHPLNTAARRILPLATLAALFAASPASAQTAAGALNVVELEYAPTAPLPGLDLRAGSYLLELRGPAAGPYAGVLRGPNNETVDDKLTVTTTGCGSGLPAAGRIVTSQATARPLIDPVVITIGAAGTCRMSTSVNSIGSVTATPPDAVPSTCGDDEDIKRKVVGTTGPGPSCNEGDPNDTTPRPDLILGPGVNIGGQMIAWNASVELPASLAVAKSQGRCYFNYANVIRNTGVAPSGATVASMHLGDWSGPRLDSQTFPPLAAGTNLSLSGQIGLPPGNWIVYAFVDSEYLVIESNGVNNARGVGVKVTGSCVAATGSP